jgi:hypothetical protein
MGNSKQTELDRDIAEQAYAGPSAFITSLGQGAVDHLKLAAIGIVAGGVLGAALHKPITPHLNNFRHTLAGGLEHKNIVIQYLSKIGQGVFGRGDLPIQTEQALKSFASADAEKLSHWANEQKTGFGLWFFNHTIGLPIPPLKRWVGELINKPDSSLATGITIGGTFGSLGYAYGWINALIHGHKHATLAKDQFHKAKEEVIKLRNEKAEQQTAAAAEAAPETTAHEEKSTIPAASPTHAAKHHHEAPSTHIDAATIVHPHKQHGHHEGHAENAHNHADWKKTVAAQKTHAHAGETALA